MVIAGFLQLNNVPGFVTASFNKMRFLGIETINVQEVLLASSIVLRSTGKSITKPCLSEVSGMEISAVPACSSGPVNATAMEKMMYNGNLCTEKSNLMRFGKAYS